ncbi:MAG: NAD-dependent epimerase [candidate division Zixibacteria bacterium HGW-Zixibacteria-1]|nr:MAG: NAD-dependent epimerase [candidate division Zixibacteria bacterium HGW-Zixibacteria-1]
MTTLIVGASGATGRLLVEQLLHRGQHVKAIVRSTDGLLESVRSNPRLTLILASLPDLSDTEIIQHIRGCDAVASCLGHNLSLMGIYGHPRRLVTDATRRLCQALKATGTGEPRKFVLMNTTGSSNRDLREPRSIGDRLVIGLIRRLLPPFVDNERAADYLRSQVGQNNEAIEWVTVRPDSLINEDKVTPYEVVASPTRNPIFDSGKTSRINVAHFMADLIMDDDVWKQWKGQMPVLYNKDTSQRAGS